MMKLCYDLETWENLNIKLPVKLSLTTHIHFLITGVSGSGKSYALLFLLLQLISEPNIVIWFFDFKNSEDFSFLQGYNRYRTADNCIQGIEEFYSLFTSVRKGEVVINSRNILIVDEFPSLINYMLNLDKANKTKEADKVLRYISELLMLGRGIGFGVWIVTQRADANLFAGGSRDNFMVVIGLGRISKEQRQMLFFGEELSDRIYKTGEGIILADGNELQEIKFPCITDINKAKRKFLDWLMAKDYQQP